MNKVCVITISEDEKIDVSTNGVSYIKIYSILGVLQKHFAQELVKEAEKMVGKDKNAQEKYLDDLIKRDENNNREITHN